MWFKTFEKALILHLVLFFRPVRLCPDSTGYSVFAIGVADVDFVELQEIGSKPSDRHVFVVDDFDAFDTIKENLITFICETATSCQSPQQQTQSEVFGSGSELVSFLFPQRVH